MNKGDAPLFIPRATDTPNESAEPVMTDASFVLDLRRALQDGKQALKEAYLANGNPTALLRGTTRLLDSVLQHIWHTLAPDRQLCLAAVGGYGRREQYPGSDVDLLILLPDGSADIHRPTLERLIGLFWDIGLDIGHSVRSVGECLEEAERDITVQTTLLETRFLCGSRQLYTRFRNAYDQALDPLAFFKAKQIGRASCRERV